MNERSTSYAVWVLLAILSLASAPPVFAQFFTRATNEVVFHDYLQLAYWRSDEAAYYVPPREWQTIDLKRIDPRFSYVVSVDIEGLMFITGPGRPGILCQIWVAFRKPGSNLSGPHNYQWQIITESDVTYQTTAPSEFGVRTTVPTVQQPRKRIALTDGTLEAMWAFEPGCSNGVNMKIVSALLP